MKWVQWEVIQRKKYVKNGNPARKNLVVFVRSVSMSTGLSHSNWTKQWYVRNMNVCMYQAKSLPNPKDFALKGTNTCSSFQFEPRHLPPSNFSALGVSIFLSACPLGCKTNHIDALSVIARRLHQWLWFKSWILLAMSRKQKHVWRLDITFAPVFWVEPSWKTKKMCTSLHVNYIFGKVWALDTWSNAHKSAGFVEFPPTYHLHHCFHFTKWWASLKI